MIIKMIVNDLGFLVWIWYGSGFILLIRIVFFIFCKFNLKFYFYEVLEDFYFFCFFFECCGVCLMFSDFDLLDILGKIKEKYDIIGVRNEGVIEDQKFLCDIFYWIVRDGKLLSFDLCIKFLVFVMIWDNILKLVFCSECIFCDVIWLMKGGLEFLVISQYLMIFDKIFISVVEFLGVLFISMFVICVEVFGIEQIGFYELIIIRFKNILSEYKEGVGVFWEFVQNVDDVGVIEVKFVFDWCNYLKKSFLVSGMVDC